MNISVDGGALCDQKHPYGTYRFTYDVLNAFALYDKQNQYTVYTFAQVPLRSHNNVVFKLLRPQQFWMSVRVSIEEFLHPKAVYLGLSQAIPIYTSGRVISFCQGLSYYLYPDYYPQEVDRLKNQLQTMIQKSDVMVVSSEKVKQELIKLFPSIKIPVPVLPFGIPVDFRPLPPEEKPAKQDYFLYVGNNLPIKNIDFLINAFIKFRTSKKYPGFRLYLVGSKINTTGMDGVVNIPAIEREILRQLYTKATAYLTASHYESFNYPVLEALSQRCPVVSLPSAVIPELKPYVHLCDNEDEFVKAMRKSITAPKKINTKQLVNDFSWERHVKALNIIYKELGG